MGALFKWEELANKWELGDKALVKSMEKSQFCTDAVIANNLIILTDVRVTILKFIPKPLAIFRLKQSC